MNTNPESKYKLGKLIGQGGFGSVYVGEQLSDNWLVAIKIISVMSNAQVALSEIRNLKKCDSKFIVHYKGVYKKNNTFWIVMEYCRYGSLGSYIRSGFHLNESEIRDVLACSLYGLTYLHKNKILHRDIKPDNLFLSEDGTIKIGDFGLSAQLNSSISHRNGECGTYMYMAPEVFNKGATMKSDIWALGITAIELAEGKNPYANFTEAQITMRVCFENSPSLSSSHWSANFVDFVNKCLIKNMEDRPSAEDLANHPFVKDAMERIRREGKSEILLQLTRTIPNISTDVAEATKSEELVELTEPAEPAEATLFIQEDENYYEICNNTQVIHTVHVASNRCNIEEITEWNLNIYSYLNHVIIGDHCFMYLKQFCIQDMPIKTIQIGTLSCSHCTVFKIKHCNDLQRITIGDKSFNTCEQTDIEDCSQLHTITLGKDVFSGNDQNQNSLIMKNLTALTEIIGKLKVFKYVKHVNIENVHHLEILQLPLAFALIETVSLQDASLFDKIKELKERKDKMIEEEERKRKEEEEEAKRRKEEEERDKQLREEERRKIEYVTVHTAMDWQQLTNQVVELTITSNYNDDNLTVVDFSSFTNVTSVNIGDNCFIHAKDIIFNNMHNLKTITIGVQSFTEWRELRRFWEMSPRNARFICTNNSHLTSLIIGCGSFSDCNECKLENLPSLQSLIIGDMTKRSYNFLDHTNFKLSNLPQLQTITLGHGCFMNSVHTVIENLPQLKQIQLGVDALKGKYGNNNDSVTMRNLPSLSTISSNKSSFKNARLVIFENILHVNHVILPDSFRNVHCRTLNNVHSALASLVQNKKD